MDFKLSNIRYWVEEDYAKRLEKLGFEVKREDRPDFSKYYGQYYVDKCEFPNSDLKISINTLEELMLFIKEYGEIILDEDSITIFDDELA